jgi:hypothetical protein
MAGRSFEAFAPTIDQTHMSIALLSGVTGIALMILLWLVLQGIGAVVKAETVGQMRRASRALVRRSVRRLPSRERPVVLRRLRRDLDERQDRPISQFLFAIRCWRDSLDRRQLVPMVKLGMVWVGGMDPRLARAVPSELTTGVAGGLAVVQASVLVAVATALILHEWLAASLAWAIAFGCAYGVVWLLVDQLCLSSVTGAPWWRKIVPTTMVLLVQCLMGWMVATAFQLRLFHDEIIAQASHSHPRHEVGFYNGLVTMQEWASSVPLVRLEQILLTLLIVSIISMPMVLRALRTAPRWL